MGVVCLHVYFRDQNQPAPLLFSCQTLAGDGTKMGARKYQGRLESILDNCLKSNRLYIDIDPVRSIEWAEFQQGTDLGLVVARYTAETGDPKRLCGTD